MKTITIISKEQFDKLPNKISGIDKHFGLFPDTILSIVGKKFEVISFGEYENIRCPIIQNINRNKYYISPWLIKKDNQLEFEF